MNILQILPENMLFLYYRVGELVIVECTMKGIDYTNILDHNMFGDAMVPFLFEHDNSLLHTARNVHT